VDSATQLQYLVGGNNGAGRVNLSRDTAAAALKKAREFLNEGYVDVRICTPRGQILQPDEFVQLEA
jgi:sigma54-dependent transcription regulator